MVITAKKDGSPRRTVDLAALTKAGVRETHHTRSPFNVVRSVPSGKLKTTLDCKDVCHSVPLVNSDRHKTTFITETGRYRYARAPQGYYLETIANLPKPSNISDIRSWFGMVQQGAYSFCKTIIMEERLTHNLTNFG